jgi:hypothetical protein
VEIVEAVFIVDPEEDEDCAGHADGEAGDIEDRETFAAPEVAEGYFEIVLEHDDEWLRRIGWRCIAAMNCGGDWMNCGGD